MLLIYCIVFMTVLAASALLKLHFSALPLCILPESGRDYFCHAADWLPPSHLEPNFCWTRLVSARMCSLKSSRPWSLGRQPIDLDLSATPRELAPCICRPE